MWKENFGERKDTFLEEKKRRKIFGEENVTRAGQTMNKERSGFCLGDKKNSVNIFLGENFFGENFFCEIFWVKFFL